MNWVSWMRALRKVSWLVVVGVLPAGACSAGGVARSVRVRLGARTTWWAGKPTGGPPSNRARLAVLPGCFEVIVSRA